MKSDVPTYEIILQVFPHKNENPTGSQAILASFIADSLLYAYV